MRAAAWMEFNWRRNATKHQGKTKQGWDARSRKTQRFSAFSSRLLLASWQTMQKRMWQWSILLFQIPFNRPLLQLDKEAKSSQKGLTSPPTNYKFIYANESHYTNTVACYLGMQHYKLQPRGGLAAHVPRKRPLCILSLKSPHHESRIPGRSNTSLSCLGSAIAAAQRSQKQLRNGAKKQSRTGIKQLLFCTRIGEQDSHDHSLAPTTGNVSLKMKPAFLICLNTWSRHLEWTRSHLATARN